MNSPGDKNSPQKQDQKLEAFLKENRPLYPRHSERDAERIWARISTVKHFNRWNPMTLRSAKIFAVSLGTITAVAVISVSLQYSSNTPTSQTAAVGGNEASLIEDSLELNFLDNEEMYEVTDLLSLGK